MSRRPYTYINLIQYKYKYDCILMFADPKYEFYCVRVLSYIMNKDTGVPTRFPSYIL